MKTLKLFFKLLGVVIVMIILFSFLLSHTSTDTKQKIIHTYIVSDNKDLLVDNWDCGATCPFQTKVILQTKSGEEINEEELLSCLHISDLELSEISHNSVRITRMIGDDSECDYKEGDLLFY
ncbi:hypothetical protein [uncultured Dokdonia sp.]|uniref:hypothetical protein n=1 Tax=uncultured Dokdonia sp. TaxID=575653 RepID=UPI00262282C9|nr:hypothetical protein [uncultured Dokdonia sp.]